MVAPLPVDVTFETSEVADPAVSASSPRRPWGRRNAIVGLGAVALLGVGWMWVSGDGDETVSIDSVPPSTEPRGPLTAAEIYDAVTPSFVIVQSFGSDDTQDSTGDDGGLGSGVIVNADGTILTSLHVVDDSTRIEVTFADGTTSPAQVVIADAATDTATLIADRNPDVVVPAVLGGVPDVGAHVVAIGNPLGLIASTTEGVVSGLGRSLRADEDSAELSGLIQFDAAVNPGSSGGPLLDDQGRLVGIVTAIANHSETGFFIGVGFAVPIAAAGGGGDGDGPGNGPQK